MRKIIIMFALIAIFCVSGCTNKNAGSGVVQTDSKTGENVVLIKGFNDYYGCVATSFGNSFGRAEVNENKAFITEGTGSMHLSVQGNYDVRCSYPNIRFGSDTFEQNDPNDFSSFKAIELDVYNDTDKELHILLHLTTYGTTGEDFDSTAVKETLIPNSWNKVRYDFSDGSLKKATNGLKNVREIILQFLEYKTSRSDDTNSIYLDNLVGIKGQTKVYAPIRENNEILFFENEGDINLVGLKNFYNPSTYNNPIVSLNKDKNFVSQGEGSMKVEVLSFTDVTIHFDPLVAQGTAPTGKLSLDVFNDSEYPAVIYSVYITAASKGYGSFDSVNAYSMGTVEIDYNGENLKDFYVTIYSCTAERVTRTLYFDNIRRK